MPLKVSAVILISLLLFGCDSSEPPVEKQEKTFVEKQLSTQLDALEKAKDVEGQLDEAAKKRESEMQKSGI